MDDPTVNSVVSDGDGSDLHVHKPNPKSRAAPKAVSKAATAKKAIAPKKTAETTLKAMKAATSKKRAKLESDTENEEPSFLNDFVNDDSLLSNTPPSAKRQKKVPVATAAKKAAAKPLQPADNESFGSNGVPEIKKKTSSTEQYQKLTQLEHILKRPDTYIGSVEPHTTQMWVYNSETDAMENREVTYVPGLYKIFDEILVNAADNKQRDKNMDEIKVTIDREKGEVSVRNNGRGIPVEIHAKEGIYIPEMIFGHLLTSSNYDDDQEKVTGGRNGYGAKLTNIFSTNFILETADSKTKKKYRQAWSQNMAHMEKAKITDCKGEDFTKVTFTPDFRKFGMSGMDSDFEALVKRRVYDMAGTCKGVKVSLNGERISVRTFKKYMEMYTKAIKAETMQHDAEKAAEMDAIITDSPHERWEIGFAVSDGSFQQVSFVNSIATTSGGTHVNYIADQIVNKLAEIVKKKNKGGVTLKPAQIRNHLFLFVNCLITNPAFTSQTKEQLTTKASQFGSKCTVSEEFLKKISKTKAVDNILHFAQKKADQVLQKSDGSKRSRMNNSKLTDANKAGTKDGWQCTLILTEGDSASLLALAGRAVVNPDLFGVFPLRGKLLNVRDASIDQISKNQEIQNIKKFMGLQHKKNYEDTKSLRYGHLMIMTDQDHDGSHIKGLLINFLQCSFPSLLKLPGFLMEFITPIVKVWQGDPKHPKKARSFFTMPEYEAWKEEPGNSSGKWEHKYYKGLGTSSPADAEIYFRDLDRHLKEFHTMHTKEEELIDLAFSKKKADARKEWLREFRPGTYLDMSASHISYEDFVNKELILYSMADNMRSIPSVVDGLKPGQRKVLYTCFRRNLKKDVKVVELAGSVSGLTAYAYGDVSLQQTIVGLAQNFVGSNNINCLEPSGNFGSRLQGGSDSASARYIYTRLSPFARKLFHVKDEPLLTYNMDDGKTIEPEIYMPILPMILVNGADGIGTGWSSQIPNYRPEDIVDNLKRRMVSDSKDSLLPMKPWFKSWEGEVEDLGNERYKFSGAIRQTGPTEVEITELPVRVWTQDFKDRLEDIIKAEKVPSFIKDYIEYNTPERVHFIIKLEEKHMNAALEKGLESAFKLEKTISTTNLVAFDAHGRIHKYATVLDIMEEFYHLRLKFYEKRKQYMLAEMQKELEKLSNQSRFIKMIIDGTLIVARKKKKELVVELKKKGFKPFPKVVDARKEGEMEAVVEDNVSEEGDEEIEAGASDYDYLLGMAIWSLTQERVERLLNQIGDKEVDIDILIKTSPKELWTKDLDDFLAEWHFQLEDERVRARKIANMGRRASNKLRIGGGKGKTTKRKAAVDDEDADSDFAVNKKAATAKKVDPKPSSMFNYLVKKEPTQQSQPLLNAVEQKPVAKPPALMIVDNASDPPLDIEEDLGVKSRAPALTSKSRNAAKPLTKVEPKPRKQAKIDSDSEDEVIAAVAARKPALKEKETVNGTPRAPRAATRKPVKYTAGSDEESSDGDNMLGDVSNMVRGIGASTTSAVSNGRPLFSATSVSASRPTSNSTTTSKSLVSTSRPAASRQITHLGDDGEDETDYTKSIPKGSPIRQPLSRSPLLNDEDLDEDTMDIMPLPKVRASSVKPTGAKSVAAAKAKPSEKGKPASAALAQKKPATSTAALSPQAKAYAKKQEKIKAASASSLSSGTSRFAPKKKTTISEDEEEEEDDADVDKIANEMLSDSDTPASAPAPALREAPARPARRAAATAAAKEKPVYVVSDEDSVEEESEAYSDGSE